MRGVSTAKVESNREEMNDVKAQPTKGGTIQVQNAEGVPDTTAYFIAQNKIDYVPKVSVIIPVHNAEAYLRECLDSVVNQTLKEIEVICIDDGSTDSSLSILREYAQKDSRISVLQQENLHAGVARNAGIAVAQGEYIHFLDSDDWVDANTYEKLTALITRYGVEVLKFCSFSYDSQKKKIVSSYFTDMRALQDNDFEKSYSLNHDYKLLVRVSDAPWSGIYLRHFLLKYNVRFDNLLCANDTSFFYRCLLHAKNVYITKEKFVYYRINNISSLIGIRAHNFDCQIHQFFIILNTIRSCQQDIISCVRQHLINSIYYRYLTYIKNPHLEAACKENIRTLIRDFNTHVCRDEVNVEYLAYFDDIREEKMPEREGREMAHIVAQNRLDFEPKVSVIIPVYNAEEFLKECLESVVNQTLRELEIICVDDASTDHSLEILKGYARENPQITIISNSENAGAPGAVKNLGLSCAKGAYIGFVDADDYIDTHYFEELFNLAVCHSADIAATRAIVRFSGNKESKTVIPCTSNVLVTIAQKKELMIKSGSNCNKIYKRELLDTYHIRCYEKRNIAEDNYFSMAVMSVSEKIVLTDRVAYYYRKRKGSVTADKRTAKDFLIFDVYAKVEAFIRSAFKNKEEPYIQTVREREYQDFTWFIHDCDEKWQLAFKKRLAEEFPDIYHKIVPRDLIVSLTSYPSRIGTVNQTIESLLDQSLKPDKLILWLAPEQFPNEEANLPQKLLDLQDQGLTIDWYHDIGPYKKLIPTLKKYPDAIIVTADDDNIYERDWLKKLFDGYQQFPHDIQCHRVTKFFYNGRFNTIAGGHDYYKGSSFLNKLVGLGGVLYPPHCFYKDILNEELFMRLAPTNDDQWFWVQAALHGVRVRVVDQPIIEANYIPGTQEKGLTKINDAGKKLFWKDFDRLIAYYPRIKERFIFEYKREKSKMINRTTPYKQELQSWYRRISKNKSFDIDHPQTFNEKIQWLKLYDSTPIKTRLADKYLVREWVKEKIGEKYLIPLLGVYDRFEDIDFDKLPNQFVIKCNHGCGYNIIVKDKSQLDLVAAKLKVDRWMRENFAFKNGFELHYRDIKPKILVEIYLENEGTNDLYDYKFWCFNGKVTYIQFLSERNLSGLRMAFYNRKWEKQNFVYSHPLDTKNIPKPANLELMIQLAERLASEFSHVRVDFYLLNNGAVKFGEMTFTSASGVPHWSDQQIDLSMGQQIELPELAYNIDTGEYYKPESRTRRMTYQCFLLNWYRRHCLLEKFKSLCIKYIQNQLHQTRIDIKNIGTAENAVAIKAENSTISKPEWFKNAQGVGQVLTSSAEKRKIKISIITAGKLMLTFRGPDMRFGGERFPLWNDYKSIKIDGKEILSSPIAVWHDKPWRYEMPVRDGQEVRVEYEQQTHPYARKDLKETILKLNPMSEVIHENINALTDEIIKIINHAK